MGQWWALAVEVERKHRVTGSRTCGRIWWQLERGTGQRQLRGAGGLGYKKSRAAIFQARHRSAASSAAAAHSGTRVQRSSRLSRSAGQRCRCAQPRRSESSRRCMSHRLMQPLASHANARSAQHAPTAAAWLAGTDACAALARSAGSGSGAADAACCMRAAAAAYFPCSPGCACRAATHAPRQAAMLSAAAARCTQAAAATGRPARCTSAANAMACREARQGASCSGHEEVKKARHSTDQQPARGCSQVGEVARWPWVLTHRYVGALGQQHAHAATAGI